MTPQSRQSATTMVEALCCVVLLSAELQGQSPSHGSLPLSQVCARDATAGSPAERTLMTLTSLRGSFTSTTLRPLSRVDSDSLAAYLERQFDIQPTTVCGRAIAPVVATVWYNTSRANQARDGAVWQGKGATVALTGGAVARFSFVDVALRPLAFATENRAFGTAPFPPAASPTDFRDPVNGSELDLPYRFGPHGYARVDPGESYVRLAYRGAAFGATTESAVWGPLTFYPLVRGTEGPAYPRAYAEARSLPVVIGRVTGHWEVGLLEASPYSALSPGNRSRVAAAFTGSFVPAPFPSLELGATRFFHVRRARNSLRWSTAMLPFSGLLKTQSVDSYDGGFNQVASGFFRLAPARSGGEVYGEYYREDHSADARDLAVELDHESAWALGFRRAWPAAARVNGLVVEYANGKISHLKRVRGEGPMYTHTAITEGHSYLGQPLGSSVLIGGGGLTVAWSRVERDRALDVGFSVEGTAQNHEGGTFNGALGRTIGAYVTRSCVVAARLMAATAELRHGTGFDERGNLTLGVSMRTAAEPGRSRDWHSCR